MSAQNLKIRPLKPEDFDAWSPLWDGYLKFYEIELTDDVTKATWNRFFDDSEKIYAIGIFDQSSMLGFAHYTLHRSTWTPDFYCYLEDLFVDPNVRGGGVGRKLIEAVKQRAEDNHCVRLYWVTNKDNARARGLYDKVADLSDFVQYRIGL